MELSGLIAFILALSLSWKLKGLERRLLKLGKRKGGTSEMSKIIDNLVGSKCKIHFSNDLSSGIIYTIVEVDEEWVKIATQNKKGVVNTTIARIDTINRIDVITE